MTRVVMLSVRSTLGIRLHLPTRVGQRQSIGMAETGLVSRWQAVSTSITYPLGIIPPHAKW